MACTNLNENTLENVQEAIMTKCQVYVQTLVMKRQVFILTPVTPETTTEGQYKDIPFDTAGLEKDCIFFSDVCKLKAKNKYPVKVKRFYRVIIML